MGKNPAFTKKATGQQKKDEKNTKATFTLHQNLFYLYCVIYLYLYISVSIKVGVATSECQSHGPQRAYRAGSDLIVKKCLDRSRLQKHFKGLVSSMGQCKENNQQIQHKVTVLRTGHPSKSDKNTRRNVVRGCRQAYSTIKITAAISGRYWILCTQDNRLPHS